MSSVRTPEEAAAEVAGEAHPSRSHPTPYLNGDVATARLQIERMLEGSPVRMDDLGDDAFVLVAATLPHSQRCADPGINDVLFNLGVVRWVW